MELAVMQPAWLCSKPPAYMLWLWVLWDSWPWEEECLSLFCLLFSEGKWRSSKSGEKRRWGGGVTGGKRRVWEKNKLKTRMKLFNFMVGINLNLLDKLLLFLKGYNDMYPEYGYSFENILTIDRFWNNFEYIKQDKMLSPSSFGLCGSDTKIIMVHSISICLYFPMECIVVVFAYFYFFLFCTWGLFLMDF